MRRAGSSSSSPARAAPPPITTSSGSKVLIALAMPIPTRSPHSSISRAASGSPSWAASTASTPVSLRRRRRAACPAPSPDGRSRERGGQPVEGMAGGDGLQRARLRETCRRPGTGPLQVHADERVAELAGAAGGAAVDPAAEHQPAADAGADREHHQVAGDHLQILVVGLGERGDGRVVVDEHRHAEPLAEHLAQRHVDERDVHRGDHAPGLEVDDRGHADADPVQIVAAALLRPGRRAARSAPRRSSRSVGASRRADQLATGQAGDGDLRAAEIDPDDVAHRCASPSGSSRAPRRRDRAAR